MQSLDRLKSERPRKAYDFYETPYELCRDAFYRLRRDESHVMPRRIYAALDPGAGSGVWGRAFRDVIGTDRDFIDDIQLCGIELQDIPKPEGYDIWMKERDYLDKILHVGSICQGVTFDLIFGNPPYSIAEEFVRQSFKLVEDRGYIFFLLRLAFLESKKRHFGLFTEFPPKRVYVLSRRPSFFTTKEKSRTVDAISYAMFLWQEGWRGKPQLDWLYWEYDK